MEIGEQPDGPWKGKPFVKVICDDASLRSVLEAFQKVMQISSVIDRIKQGVKVATTQTPK